MKSTTVLAALLVASVCHFQQSEAVPQNIGQFISSVFCGCSCGQLGSSGSRSLPSRGEGRSAQSAKLLGGDESDVRQWMTLIMHKGSIVANGVVISKRFILTAASPIAKANVYDVKVRVAVHERCVGDITSANISVEAIEIHPMYSPATSSHNIALCRLASTLELKDSIRPICMPNPRFQYTGKVASIISWTSPTAEAKLGDASCEPRRLKAPILSDEDCSKGITSPSLYTADKACIGVVGSKSQICSGDVGASIQFENPNRRHELLGIMPDINVCGQTNNTLYIKVLDHLQWITNTINGLDCLCRSF